MRACWFITACAALVLAGGAAAAAPAEVDSGGTAHGYRILATARQQAYHGHLTAAIERAGTVIDNAPDFAEAYVLRADFFTQAGRYDEALADINRAASMHPEAVILVLLRAEIAVRRRDVRTALAELTRANTMPDETVWKRQYVDFGIYTGSRLYALQSIALELKHDDDGALADFQHMMTFQTVYPWYILGYHCYNAAVAGLAEMAQLSCDEAIRLQGHDRGNYDSRGLADLKLQQWTRAVSDYNQALVSRPDLTLSLYGRGVARLALGDKAGGNADMDAARQGEPDIANIMGRLGVK